MAPIKQFWDDGKLAILHGVGWKESPRSHFRAMDIWHTCEPVKVGPKDGSGASPANLIRRKRTLSPPSASDQVCRGHWRCRACRWRASPVRWKGTASCRPFRGSSASRCSAALRRCTNRDRSGPVMDYMADTASTR